MKKVIPFVKDIKFNTKIYEITSISLENTLSACDNNFINGEFIISGDYKMNDSSINTEPFIYGLPFEINMDEEFEKDKLKIDIDDFKYEIINEESLRVNIDVLLEGELKKTEEEFEDITPDVLIQTRQEIPLEESSETDTKQNTLNDENKDEDQDRLIINNFLKNDDNIEKSEDLFKLENNEAQAVFDDVKNNKVTSIFDHFDNDEENYISYYVHIVRENENIDTIANMYKVSLEDLKEYNNIEKVTLGNKIIIPHIKTDEKI